MSQTNIHEAKTRLSHLIQQALAGEDVVIARSGEPVVKIVPLKQKSKTRKLGGWRGAFDMADDFDATPPEFKDYLA